MAEYKSHSAKTKSGKDLVIRSAFKADAAELLTIATNVMREKIYQLSTEQEFKTTLQEEEKWIEDHLSNPNHIIIAAELDSKIVGFLDFANGHRQRLAHTGELAISIEKQYRDQGIGAILMQALIDWAKTNSVIEKIGLQVHSTNDRAIALYKKMGFEIEGCRKRDLKYADGQYVDTIVMGRFVK